MTTADLPQDVRDRHRGERIYVPKGWTTTRERDQLIRRQHRENVRVGMPRMVSIAKLAAQFRVSESTIQRVIYS